MVEQAKRMILWRCRVCQREQAFPRRPEDGEAAIREVVCGQHVDPNDPSLYLPEVSDASTRWFAADGGEVPSHA
jgi:hypothetical protein